MAVAVIGGLLISTLLSLIFVPSLFSALEALRSRVRTLPSEIRRIARRRLGHLPDANAGGKTDRLVVAPTP
jgi:hypothetical protein